jgi:anthranilate phosphoribosyltransferase
VERIGEDFDDLEDEDDERMLRMIMSGEYPDAEIDHILETFSMSGT